MKKKARKIAEQIIFYIGRVVVIVMLVIAVVASIMVQNQVTESKERELELESEVAVQQLAGFFDRYVKMTNELAVNPQIRELLIATTAGQNLTQMEGYPTVFDNLLSIQQTDAENVLATWIADVDANMVTQSDKFTSGEGWEITQRVWYVSIQTKQTILTAPYVDASTGQMILSAVAPVFDYSGNAIGVAGMDISMAHIIEIMPEYKVGKNGYVMLLSGDGTIIYHPDSKLMQKNIADIDISEQVIEAVQNGTEGFVNYKFDGNKKYGCIMTAGDTGYLVISNMSSGEYFSEINTVIGVLLGVFIVGMMAIVLVMKKTAVQIVKPVTKLNETAQKLAEGDLDVEIEVTSEDEIGELGKSIGATVARLKEYINYINEISAVLDQMADGKLAIRLTYDYVGEFQKVKEALVNISDSMKDVMEGITESAEQVSAGADELAVASQSLAEGAGNQAAAVQELVATVATVAEQVEENRRDAETSAVQAGHVTDMMEASRTQMNRMTEAMNMIRETSQQVVGIIATIEEIAEQTNLLSLNASIEAARAGEAGRGFAVVASEIGSLAEDSAKAANTTRELIGLSLNEIQKGNEVVQEVMNSLQASVLAIEQVNEMIHKTAENAKYQAQNMDQIRIGIEEFSSEIQDNSAMAEESNATSEELAAQATNLNELVRKFDLN